jgi:deoxyribodipyrimidine photo-lyase
MQQLIDGDVAIDHWQWQSHAGVSSKGRSWFRVYNPIKSIDKIDPEGIFIRQWVPELASAPTEALSLPGLEGLDYYCPVVDHKGARREALEILEPIKLKYRHV